jgi:hypothetical protein
MIMEPRVPAKEDVLQLPRWARVAFAVRCARRVQPLLRQHLPTAGVRQVEAVERAIRLAEEVARQAPAMAPDKVVIRLRAALIATSKMAKSLKERSPQAAAIAAAAGKAAEAAEWACCQAPVKDASSAAAAASAAVAADPAALGAVYQGWEELRTAAQAEGWTHESPIPDRFFVRERSP